MQVPTRSTTPPRWLRVVGSMESHEAFLKTGLSELVRAALLAGGGQISRADRGCQEVRNWKKSFETYLGNLPSRCAVDLSKSKIPLAEILQAMTEKASEHQREGVNDQKSWGQVLAAAARPVWSPGSREAEKSALGGAEISLDYSQLEPRDVAQMALRAIVRNQKSKTFHESDLAGLKLIGAAARAIERMHGCGICYRLARAERRFCIVHSVDGKRGTTEYFRSQRRYQAGRRVKDRYDYGVYLKSLPESYNVVRKSQMPFVLARILWSTTFPREREISERFWLTLQSCPEVLAEIARQGVSIREADIVEALRKALDPLEYRPGAWASKLRAAQIWFTQQENACPTKRRTSRKTDVRLRSAALHAQPGWRLSSVADLMGITPSALSHLLKARKDDPRVLALRQVLAGKPLEMTISDDEFTPTAFRA